MKKKHSRRAIMAKRAAAHAAREMQPFKAPIIVDGIYCHRFRDQVISNCTGRPVE